MTRKTNQSKGFYSRNSNHGLGGGLSGQGGSSGGGNLLETNWTQFGGGRFRTQQNINLTTGNIAAGGVQNYYN